MELSRKQFMYLMNVRKFMKKHGRRPKYGEYGSKNGLISYATLCRNFGDAETMYAMLDEYEKDLKCKKERVKVCDIRNGYWIRRKIKDKKESNGYISDRW